jgi:hypothetical protein
MKVVTLMRCSHFGFIGFLACIAATFIWWQGDEDKDHDSYQNAQQPVTLAPGASGASIGDWGGAASPFLEFSCKLANGDTASTSACQPDSADRQNLVMQDDARLDAKAKNALTKIEARAYEALPILVSSYTGCWLINASALDQPSSGGQASASECDFPMVESLVEKALSSIYGASQQGDYMAQRAYVDLMMTKIWVSENQLPLDSDEISLPATKLGLEKVQDKIDAARSQAVTFIQSLKEPPESSLDVLRNLIQARERQIQHKQELTQKREKPGGTG